MDVVTLDQRLSPKIVERLGDTKGQLGPTGPDGATRLMLPGDNFGGRYVSNLVSLQVVDLAPAHTSST